MRSALVIALLSLPAIANAHIYLTAPRGRGDAPNGDPQKNRHCGVTGRMADRVTTLTPGATISIKFRETINHPGWYRISFQPNGETFRIPPASNGPMAGGGVSNYPTENMTGMTDADTGSMILMDRILDDGNLVSKDIQVTLPNMECTNCTLQVLSVMTAGATYNPANGGSLYFQCADITLAANAPDAGVIEPMADASVEEPGNNPDPTDPGKVSGGCSTGADAGWPALFALAGLVSLFRRRRV